MNCLATRPAATSPWPPAACQRRSAWASFHSTNAPDGSARCCSDASNPYELYLAVENIDHTRTKAKSPQTNGGFASELWSGVLTNFGPPLVPQPTVSPTRSGDRAWTGEPRWIYLSSFDASMSLVLARLPG